MGLLVDAPSAPSDKKRPGAFAPGPPVSFTRFGAESSGVLPLLLLLGGFPVEAAISVLLLIGLLALIGLQIEPFDTNDHDPHPPRRKRD